jgi:hypothetical protein
MTFTDENLGGRSQDLTCAEANDKIVIDKLLVNKLTDLVITLFTAFMLAAVGRSNWHD